MESTFIGLCLIGILCCKAAPVYVAYVCLYLPDDPGQWLTNITNDSGHCEFIVNGSAAGAKITATKHNFVPGQKTVSGP